MHRHTPALAGRAYKPQRTKLNDDHTAKLIAGFALLVLADFMKIRQPIE